MKITLEQHEVLEFIEKLLATQGMKSTELPIFKHTKNNTEVMVVCTPSDIPNKCLVCGHNFHEISMTSPPLSVHKIIGEEEKGEEEEIPSINLMEGEVLEPPFNNEGMASIVAQSHDLERKLEVQKFKSNKKSHNH